jgi:STE24 endopeptidase
MAFGNESGGVMEKTNQDRAKQYNRLRMALGVGEFTVAVAFMAGILISGWSLRIRILLGSLLENPYLLALVFSLTLLMAQSFLTLPLSFIGGYTLEHRYGLSNQSVSRWAGEKLKSMAVGAAVFTPLFLLFYLFLRKGQETWWIYTGVMLFLFSVLMARLAPILIYPLFYRFQPLDDRDLEARLKGAASRAGFRVERIFRFDMSKNTRKANAALTGLGKSRRIILADTLLEKFTPEEIESVFSHELGHHRLGHIPKLIAAGTVLTFLGLYLTHVGITWSTGLLRSIESSYGGLDDPAFLPLFGLFLIVYGLVTTPLQNTLSRKYEFDSDAYAVANGPGKAPFISAMEKLADRNLADREPHPALEFIFYSHPSIQKRINAAAGPEPSER